MLHAPMSLLLFVGAAGERRFKEPSQALLAAARLGDHAALEQLFEILYPLVERVVVRHLGPGPDLDDVVQTTMMALHQSLSRFNGRSALSTWVYRICLNQVRMYLRAKGTRERLLADAAAHEVQGQPSGTFERLEAKEQWRVASSLIRRLPETQRDIFVLVDMEGLKPAEAAKVLEINDRAAWVRLHRARKRFWELAAQDPHFQETKDEA